MEQTWCCHLERNAFALLELIVRYKSSLFILLPEAELCNRLLRMIDGADRKIY